jgi:hypothetical protein
MVQLVLNSYQHPQKRIIANIGRVWGIHIRHISKLPLNLSIL